MRRPRTGPTPPASPLRHEPRSRTAASPTAATGRAGARSATTSTVTTTDGHQADAEHGALRLGRRGGGGAQGAVVHDADDRAAVTPAAASAGSAMWAKKAPPERWRWPSTMRFVRFEPGSSSDPALERSRQA